MEEQVKEIANRMKRFLRYNKMLRDQYHVMLVYTLPDEDPSQTEAEVACVKKMMPDIKLIPLEESDRVFQEIPDLPEPDVMKAYFDSMKGMIEWAKPNKRYVDCMKRAALLCLLYEQIHQVIAIHAGHVIDPLLALEDKLYAPKPVDTKEFAMKIVNTMEFYKQPKVKYSTVKEDAYCFLYFMNEQFEPLRCHDVVSLREKVLSLPDDSREMKHLQQSLDEDFTPQMVKLLFSGEHFDRAYALDRFYVLLDRLTEDWKKEQIRKALNKEEQLYTLPVPWLNRFLENLENELVQ